MPLLLFSPPLPPSWLHSASSLAGLHPCVNQPDRCSRPAWKINNPRRSRTLPYRTAVGDADRRRIQGKPISGVCPTTAQMFKTDTSPSHTTYTYRTINVCSQILDSGTGALRSRHRPQQYVPVRPQGLSCCPRLRESVQYSRCDRGS